MKILVAKTAGFCMGVQRAVEMVLEAPGKHKHPIYTYGPLIHNPQVLHLLEEKGITVLHDIPEKGEGTVLVRAHGVPPEAKEKLKAAGFSVIDATCPRVIKVQTIIRKHAGENHAVIIIGDKDHPEVIGLLGYAGDKGYVAGSIEELEALPVFEKAIIVAQTTQNTLFFNQVKDWAKKNHPNYKVFETICDSTEGRQAEVERLARSVDAVVVVGGHNSGNTQRLLEIAKEAEKPAYHVETEAELDSDVFSDMGCVGITAGASTPNWIIRRICRSLECMPLEKGHGWKRRLYVLRRVLLLTNIYVALGAGCLCFAAATLQGISYFMPYVLISVLYVQSMHLLNNLTGMKADQYNDPDRAEFYQRHFLFLTVLALLSGGVGLLVAAARGIFSFLLLLAMSLLGLSYNLKLIPDRVSFRYHRIRDIPGSKTVLIAMAWGVVTAVYPPLSAWSAFNQQILLLTLVTFIWATGMAFVRTAFFDILDVQGDRIMGKETLPILIGEQWTMHLLKAILLGLFVILFLPAEFGLIPGLAYLLTLCPIFMLLLILAYEGGYVLAGSKLEFMMESHFVLAGVITLGWLIFT